MLSGGVEIIKSKQMNQLPYIEGQYRAVKNEKGETMMHERKMDFLLS